jgi:hypothetical protein
MKNKREVIAAELGRIIGTVSKIDRDSKRAERTDLDAVWTALYDARNAARRALRAHMKEHA